MLTGFKDRGGYDMQPSSTTQYEILERKYSYTIASTGFGAKHFYEFLTVQFANRAEKATIRERDMLMLKLSGFRRPILARVVYICHYEKKERPSVTFEVYFSQDDATNKNIYGRKARPTTTSSGLRGYRYVNIIPVKEELLKYDKLWSVDLGYLGDLLCSWDTKIGMNFYGTMHMRHVDGEMQVRTHYDPPKTCPVRIMTAEAYYRYRCVERAILSLPCHRPGVMKILQKKLVPLDDNVHYLVFVRMLSHNKRLEEYPATRLAFDPKPRLRKDAMFDDDFVDKIVLSENPVLNAKYDGPSNNLRSKESKRVLMRAMIILAEGRQSNEEKETARKKKLSLSAPHKSKLLGSLTAEQARLQLERIRKKRGRPTKAEQALREELRLAISGHERRPGRPRKRSPHRAKAKEDGKPVRFVLNLTKPLTTPATVARATKRRAATETPDGAVVVKRARGRPRKYSKPPPPPPPPPPVKEELSLSRPTACSLFTNSNDGSAPRTGNSTDSDRSSVTPPPPNSPSSCGSGNKSSTCGVHSPFTVMANSFEMMSLDGVKTEEKEVPSRFPPPPPPPPPPPLIPAPHPHTILNPRPPLTLKLPPPIPQEPPLPVAPPKPSDIDSFLLDPSLPTTDPAKCQAAHSAPAEIVWTEMETITCPARPCLPGNVIWPERGATARFPSPFF